MNNKSLVPGITPTSLLASLFAMLLMGMVVQYAEVVLGISFPAEHSLALPAIWVFLLVSALGGIFYLIARTHLLTRAELLCVFYAMLIGAPLMTQGFWHRIIAVIATHPRSADFEKMDAFNDKLWPHGENVLAGALKKENAGSLVFAGRSAWESIEYEAGQHGELPVLSNQQKDEVSTVRIRVPLVKDGQPLLIHNEPYMVSVLVHPKDLGPDASYFCRIYQDDGSKSVEVFNSSSPEKITYLHKKGFQRFGAYGTKIPAGAKDYVLVEFGLKGAGQVALSDAQLYSVGALEGIYKGKVIVTESQYAKLPVAEQGGLIVKPDNMWSWSGMEFLLAGYIPVREWATPMFAWTSIILLVLLATLAVGSIMRKQWMDRERYQMPLTRITAALTDDEGQTDEAMPAIWRNKLMWAGLIIAFAWVLLKAWGFYNPKAPNLSLRIELKPYFSGPGWGNTFERTRFEISAIFLPLCIFMELNVLISLVIGYWLFRSQHWMGEITGWKVNAGYPFAYEQAIGTYVTYGLLIVLFTRKYLWSVLKAAVTGNKAASEGEVMSYRSAFLLLIGSMAACAVWASWMGIGIGGMLLFFAFLVLIGFVAAKFRTECGLPWGYMTPYNLALFMTVMGGISTFGPQAMLFCFVASFCLGPTVFFLIPGAQLELVELGQRWRVNGRHLVTACVLGVVGGMVIGGWVFLSNAYALGGQTSRYGWAFDTKPWHFFAYNTQMNDATNAYLAQVKGAAGASVAAKAAETTTGVDPAWWAYGYAAGGTILVTALRQVFAGFWFHPIGFVLGSTDFLNYIWGSALAAWLIRGAVLWMGGAATVRNKLQPFFIGVFLGGVLAELVIGVHATFLRAAGIEKIFGVLAP